MAHGGAAFLINCGWLFRKWLRPRYSPLLLAILPEGQHLGKESGLGWPDCSYPKVPCSKLFFACLFIHLFSLFLLLCFSHRTKRSHWGKWWLFPRLIVSSWTRRAPFGQYPVGLYLMPPLSVSHPESSGFTFNHSWCGLFRVFFIPLKHYSSSWCQNHSLSFNVLPGNACLSLFSNIISQRFFLALPVQQKSVLTKVRIFRQS